MKMLRFLFLAFIVGHCSAISPNGPIVTINDGDLQGSILKSREGRDFFSFRGIPYGEVIERFQVSIFMALIYAKLNFYNKYF